ncbi:hypothetical protein BDV3_003259 [Batrachochytrium dendrobatidis]
MNKLENHSLNHSEDEANSTFNHPLANDELVSHCISDSGPSSTPLSTPSDIHTAKGISSDYFQHHQRSVTSESTPGRRDKLRKNRQSQLLLVSLLENFCMLYDLSGDKNKQLFFVLCKQLSKMGIIASSDFIEELSTVRESYKKAFRELVMQAMEEVHAVEKSQRLLIYTESDSPNENLSQPRLSLLYSQSNVDSQWYDNALENLPSRRSWPSQEMHLEGSSPSDFSEYLQTKTSRYYDDFDELDCLGRGAFGKVHRCRNRLDGREYAVKKIRLVDRNSKNIEKVLREVKLLARVADPHVVRYYSSWLEHVQVPNECSTDASDLSDDSTSCVDTSSLESVLSSIETEYSKIVFEQKAPECDATFLQEHQSDRITSIVPAQQPDLFESAVCVQGPNFRELALFIQMELCENTLHDWLERQNACTDRMISAKRKRAAIDCFSHILSGLACIHSQGLVHRDVKPKNIYWKPYEGSSSRGEWKLGDFGLATVSELPISLSPTLSDTVLSAEKSHSKRVARTIGVGTITYASPEQLDPQQSDWYTHSSDIFSLGIILFELLCVCRTGMERATLISNLRSGILPDLLVKEYPKEATLILCMTAEDPLKRPTAQQLLVDLKLFEYALQKNKHRNVTEMHIQTDEVNIDKEQIDHAVIGSKTVLNYPNTVMQDQCVQTPIDWTCSCNHDKEGLTAQLLERIRDLENQLRESNSRYDKSLTK